MINVLMMTESKNKKKKKSKKKSPAGATVDAPPTDNHAAEPQNDTQGNADPTDESEPEDSDVKPVPTSTDTSVDEEAVAKLANGVQDSNLSDDATARFDALVKDRDALRAEVTQLRQSLEGLQAKHQTELETVQTQLDDTQSEKESAEEQYQSLLGKVNTIRSQLAERMKNDAVRTWSL